MLSPPPHTHMYMYSHARARHIHDHASPWKHIFATCAVGRRWGVLFGGDGKLLAAQLVAVIAVVAWTCLFFIPYFWILRRVGRVRVGMEQELAGLDASKYGVITTNELPTMPRPRQKHYV